MTSTVDRGYRPGDMPAEGAAEHRTGPSHTPVRSDATNTVGFGGPLRPVLLADRS